MAVRITLDKNVQDTSTCLQRERPVTLRREDEVLEHFQDNPLSSLRNAAVIMGNISHDTVLTVAMLKLRF